MPLGRSDYSISNIYAVVKNIYSTKSSVVWEAVLDIFTKGRLDGGIVRRTSAQRGSQVEESV